MCSVQVPDDLPVQRDEEEAGEPARKGEEVAEVAGEEGFVEDDAEGGEGVACYVAFDEDEDEEEGCGAETGDGDGGAP